MKSLQRLALSGGFSGVLPEGIGGLSSLESLSISSPFLTGSIPSAICNLKNLKFFDLYAQQMSGGLPENIGNLSSLESLELRGRFSGPIHESIGNCKNLRLLSVDADFTSFPGSLSFMLDNKDNCNTNGDVGRFNIGGNRMSGKIPSEIVNHKNFYLSPLTSCRDSKMVMGSTLTDSAFLPAEKNIPISSAEAQSTLTKSIRKTNTPLCSGTTT